MKPKILLFAFFATLVPDSSAWAANTVSEIELRLNRTAFSDASLAKNYVSLTAAENARLNALRADALRVVKLNEAEFIRTVGKPLPPETRATIVRAMESFETWACKGPECANCGGTYRNGCVRAKRVGQATGAVAVIHPCLLQQSRCPGQPATLADWMETTLGWVAHVKITGVLKQDSGAKAGAAGARVIRSTASAVNGILGACPGPYSAESGEFLTKTGHLSMPNAALTKCGEKYLRTLQDLKKTCPEISIGPEVASILQSASANRRVRRCDSYCQTMVCQKKSRHPPFVRFGGTPTLLITDTACEGERPLRLGEFVRWTLPESIRASAAVSLCVNRVDPNPVRDVKMPDDGTGLPPGPDIPLIQN